MKQCFMSAAAHVKYNINKNAKTAMKRFSCFRHAVSHMDSACCRDVSVFYFTYCATAEIKQFRRIETEIFYCFISLLFIV